MFVKIIYTHCILSKCITHIVLLRSRIYVGEQSTLPPQQPAAFSLQAAALSVYHVCPANTTFIFQAGHEETQIRKHQGQSPTDGVSICYIAKVFFSSLHYKYYNNMALSNTDSLFQGLNSQTKLFRNDGLKDPL